MKLFSNLMFPVDFAGFARALYFAVKLQLLLGVNSATTCVASANNTVTFGICTEWLLLLHLLLTP